MIIAYTAIILLAIWPIYSGSHASLRRPSSAPSPEPGEEPDEPSPIEGLRSSDAILFPILAGCMLGGLYLLIIYVSKDWVNWLINCYMLFVGFMSNTHAVVKCLVHIQPKLRGLPKYSFAALGKDDESKKFELTISILYILAGLLSLGITASYAADKNWIASNIFGIAFAFNGIQLLALDSFRTGMILLTGLFLYDIYFVFGTEIMVTVATGIEAPIKIVFPRDIVHDVWGPATMLGLGDIVIPGIYCALSLKYDLYRHHKNNPKLPYKKSEMAFTKPYFRASLTAYLLGLLATVTVLHFVKAAQPALLYLSPACIISTAATAWHLDDLAGMWNYREVLPEEKDASISDEQTKKA